MSLQSFLGSKRRSNCFYLLLGYLFGLCVLKVIQFKLQFLLLVALSFLHSFSILKFNLLLGFADQGKISIRVKVVICLQKHDIFALRCFLMVKIKNGFQILLFEIFPLEL